MDTSSPETVGGLREELRGNTDTVAASAKNRVYSEVDARKGEAVGQVESLSAALENAAGQLDQSPAWLKSALSQTAKALEQLAQSIEGKDARALTKDVQTFARNSPGTFLASCAAAGFAAARVMKAGTEPASGGDRQGLGFGENGAAQPSYSSSSAGADVASASIQTQSPADYSIPGGI